MLKNAKNKMCKALCICQIGTEVKSKPLFDCGSPNFVFSQKEHFFSHICCETAANAVVRGSVPLLFHVLYQLIRHLPKEEVGNMVVFAIDHFISKNVCDTNMFAACDRSVSCGVSQRNLVEHISHMFVSHKFNVTYQSFVGQDGFLFVLQHLFQLYPDLVLNSSYPQTLTKPPFSFLFSDIVQQTRTRLKHVIILFVPVAVLTDLILDFCEWRPQSHTDVRKSILISKETVECGDMVSKSKRC